MRRAGCEDGPDIEETTGDGVDPTIALEGVTKHYRTGAGVDDVTLSIGPGEVFGFLGPNGAGKTTVIRMVLDFIRPDSGRIRIFGMDARADSVRIHGRIGYVPGELALYDRFTAREMLTHFGYLRGRRDWSSIAVQAERLELELDRPMRKLSKGNRQKVALVSAFAGDPELLLLDEPTSGLDPIVQQQVHAEVRRAADEGRTVFLSSHVLAEVGQVADRVGLIRSGRLIAVERVSELRRRAMHLVDATFASPVAEERFATLPGVSACEVVDHRLHLDVSGSLRPTVQALADVDLVDLSIREPTLEELFLSFYEQSHD